MPYIKEELWAKAKETKKTVIDIIDTSLHDSEKKIISFAHPIIHTNEDN